MVCGIGWKVMRMNRYGIYEGLYFSSNSFPCSDDVVKCRNKDQLVKLVYPAVDKILNKYKDLCITPRTNDSLCSELNELETYIAQFLNPLITDNKQKLARDIIDSSIKLLEQENDNET